MLPRIHRHSRAARCARVALSLGIAVLLLGAGTLPAAADPAVGVSFDEPPGDSDGDGITDDVDQCPFEPGVAENYGCPYVGPVDTDGDGVEDTSDQCPNDPGPSSNLGCPIPDSDGDGLTDDVDACPDLPGPYDGCPLPDLDGDGVHDDGSDLCPNEAGLPEYGGCPAPDSDGDGLVDPSDACPADPGPQELGGCPPPSLPEVGAKPVTFKDRCGTGVDTVRVPRSVGVTYHRGTRVLDTGTYRVRGTVTVLARAADGYVLTGPAEWTAVMTDVPCRRGWLRVSADGQRSVLVENLDIARMVVSVGSKVRVVEPGASRSIVTGDGVVAWSARWVSRLISSRSGSLVVS